jgi:hypothetical protein
VVLDYGRRDASSGHRVLGTVAFAPKRLLRVWGIAAGARLLLLNPVFGEMEHPDEFASVIAPKLCRG